MSLPIQTKQELLSGVQAAAISKKYFTGVNPTLGTAIATTTSITAFTAASPVALFFNNGPRAIVMDYLSMMIVQVPTSATHWRYSWTYDPVDRYTSGGTLVVPTSINGNIPASTNMRMRFGAIVATAASGGVRNLCTGAVRGIIPTTLDTNTFVFGDTGFSNSALLTSGSAKYCDGIPGCLIAPGHSLLLHMWGTSNAAAPSWEFTAGWYEL